MNESDLVYDVITSASRHQNPIVPWLDRCGRSYDAEGFSEYFDIWDETVGDTECLLEDWEEEAAHLRKLGRSGEIKPYLPPQRGSQRYTACHRYSFNVSPDKCDLWLVEHPHTYSLSGGEYDVFPELSQVEAKPVSIKFMVENVSGKSSHQLSMKELKAICEKVTQVLGIDGSSESEDGS